MNKVAEVQALGRNALALTGDATKAADMDRVAQQVLDGFGHLDTLVTCVGTLSVNRSCSCQGPLRQA